MNSTFQRCSEVSISRRGRIRRRDFLRFAGAGLAAGGLTWSNLAALRAEGIPASTGYGLPLYRQPLFRERAFGPYLGPDLAGSLDYTKVQCPNCETLCGEQAAWLEQNLLLGTQSDLDDIVAAFEKIHAQRAALRDWSERTD